MAPVLGRVVIVAKQRFLFVFDLRYGFRPLAPELFGELLPRLVRFDLVLCLRYLFYGLLSPFVHALGQRIQDVGGFMHPAALMASLGKASLKAPQNPSAPSPIAN